MYFAMYNKDTKLVEHVGQCCVDSFKAQARDDTFNVVELDNFPDPKKKYKVNNDNKIEEVA